MNKKLLNIVLAAVACNVIALVYGWQHYHVRLQDSQAGITDLQGGLAMLRDENHRLRAENVHLSRELGKLMHLPGAGYTIGQGAAQGMEQLQGEDPSPATVPPVDINLTGLTDISADSQFGDSPDLKKLLALIESGGADNLGQVLEAVAGLTDPGDQLTVLENILGQRAIPGEIKLQAIDLLQAMGGDPAAGVLLDYLGTVGNRYNNVTRRAVDVLATIAESDMAQTLYEAYASDHMPVRISASLALSRLGDSVPLAGLVSDLGTQFNDLDGNVRQQAVRKLSLINDPAITAYLVQGLQDTNSKTQWMTIRALGDLQDPQALPYLEELLHSDDGFVNRNTVLKAIDKINNS